MGSRMSRVPHILASPGEGLGLHILLLPGALPPAGEQQKAPSSALNIFIFVGNLFPAANSGLWAVRGLI